ncbi:MAG: SDR family oxidoreductase [Gemmatimonadales bacterium]
MSSPNPGNPRKTALVTGGSIGIGLELARQFAAHGHDLVLVARNRDALEAAAGKIEGKHGVKVTTIATDLSDPDSPERLYDAVTAEGLEIDFLINNAGFGLGGEFAETDIDRELHMIQLNIAALVHLTKLFMQPMLKRNRGRIMNVASMAGFQPGPLMSVYYASKAFVLSFSQAIDEELRNTGVSVTCLCPGATATQFAETAGITNRRAFTRIGVADAQDIARYGYAAMMRGERVAIPGMRNKIMIQAERLAPRALVTHITRRLQETR